MSMYAGVVAVPLIVGSALGLPFADLAYLLTAALLVSGLANVGRRGEPTEAALVTESATVGVTPDYDVPGGR